MELIDIIVIALAVFIVFAVIHYSITKKKKGKSTGCSGGCIGCSMSSQCSANKENNKK